MGPAARLLLEQSHLPLSAVRPTGPHNIITKGDVLEAMERAQQGGNQQPQQGQQQPQRPQQPPAAAAPPPKPQAVASSAPAPQKAPQQQQQQQQQPGRRRRGQADYVDIPNSQVRRIIAQRLQESKRTIPHTYTTADVRLDGVAGLREALKQQGTKVGGEGLAWRGWGRVSVYGQCFWCTALWVRLLGAGGSVSSYRVGVEASYLPLCCALGC